MYKYLKKYAYLNVEANFSAGEMGSFTQLYGFNFKSSSIKFKT